MNDTNLDLFQIKPSVYGMAVTRFGPEPNALIRLDQLDSVGIQNARLTSDGIVIENVASQECHQYQFQLVSAAADIVFDWDSCDAGLGSRRQSHHRNPQSNLLHDGLWVGVPKVVDSSRSGSCINVSSSSGINAAGDDALAAASCKLMHTHAWMHGGVGDEKMVRREDFRLGRDRGTI